MSQHNSQAPTATPRARPLSTQSLLSRSSSARRFHSLLFNTHARSASDSNVFTPPTRRDSITPQSIPLDTATVRPLSTVSNARPLSTVSDASTVSSTIPFPDFDSSFEPPREDDEYDTDDSDHSEEEEVDGDNDEDDDEEDDNDPSSDGDTTSRRPLFNTRELAEMSTFYGVPVTGKGRLSFDFGVSDEDSSADEAEVPAQECRSSRATWRRRVTRSTTSMSAGSRRSMLGSNRSGMSGHTGSEHHRRLSDVLGQDMQNFHISSLQRRFSALLNQDMSSSYPGPTCEPSDISSESSATSSITSSMHHLRFEHILGPGARDSWLSGLFAPNFGQWNKNLEGEKEGEEAEPILEPSPYPDFDDEAAAKVISFMRTLARDTQHVNRRLKCVLANCKWVGIAGQHGLLYLRKPDMFLEEVGFVHDRIERYTRDLKEQLVAIKGFDVGFDNTLKSWLVDGRELKDVMSVVEMYGVKYKGMMEEHAARKKAIMKEVVEEKKVLMPKVIEMMKLAEEELFEKKKDFLKKVAEKVAEEKLTDEEMVEKMAVIRLDYGVRRLGHMITQIGNEVIAESVADTESEYEPWPSSEEGEEDVEEGDGDQDDVSGTKNEISQPVDGARENWSDSDEYQSTNASSERVHHDHTEDASSEDNRDNKFSDDESDDPDSDDDDDDDSTSGDKTNNEAPASAPDTQHPEITSAEWASGVQEALENGTVFDPYAKTLQENQEIVLRILRARQNIEATVDGKQEG